MEMSEHFTYRKLLKFVIPSIGMMVFTSIYSIVDGFFVSNYAGSSQFAAINLILPYLYFFSAIGFMIGTGGTALVSMKLGEGETKKANSIFSMLVYLIIVVGIISTIICESTLSDVSMLLGAKGELLKYCIDYGRIYLLAIGAFMLQTSFQSFLIAANKPKLGFRITIIAGIANMVLDFVFVGLLQGGVKGAAFATAISQGIGGIVPLIYFCLPNDSSLRLGKTEIDLSSLWKTCSNGASEFLSNISINVVAMVYNLQLLKYIGEAGVTAYGVIMYVCFVFMAVFLGYSIGVSPLIGFNYGAKNENEVKSLYKKSMNIVGIFSILMFISSELLAKPLAFIFVGYDETLMVLTTRAFKIYSISFLLMGFNFFGSAFFTALNNGKVSATISFLRTFIFQLVAVTVLPLFFKVDGIWASNIFAEAAALAVTFFFMFTKRKEYHY